jgi:hypothetical protein
MSEFCATVEFRGHVVFTKPASATKIDNLKRTIFVHNLWRTTEH